MKKMTWLKRLTALALAGMMTLSLAACGNTGDDPGESSDAPGTPATVTPVDPNTMEDVTINIRVMNEFKNLDKVLAKYREMTKDDPILSHITPEFSWVAGGDYKDKLTMAMVANEDYDLMFCGS